MRPLFSALVVVAAAASASSGAIFSLHAASIASEALKRSVFIIHVLYIKASFHLVPLRPIGRKQSEFKVPVPFSQMTR